MRTWAAAIALLMLLLAGCGSEFGGARRPREPGDRVRPTMPPAAATATEDIP
jgi:hypothetical protein